MTSGIDQNNSVIIDHDRPMVVRTYYEINAFKAVEKIESLAFELCSVTFSCT